MRLRDGRVELIDLAVNLLFAIDGGHSYREQDLILAPGDRLMS